MEVTTQRVTIRDVSIAMQVAGSGPPLVFLHGSDGTGPWIPFYESLAATHTLYLPDHPGFGASPEVSWIRNVSDLAMLYLELLETTDVRDITIVGHALGGWIAAEMAVRSCERIASLTVLAPAGVRLAGMPSGDDFIWSPEERVRNLYADPHAADAVLAVPPTPDAGEADIRNRFAAARYGWQPRWYDPDLEKWLHRIRVPAHVIWGEEDRYLPAAYAQVWQREVRGLRVTVLPSCGHVPHIEQPERVLAAMTGARGPQA